MGDDTMHKTKLEIYDDTYAKSLIASAEKLQFAIKYYANRVNELETELAYYKKAYENRVAEYFNKISTQDINIDSHIPHTD